VSTELLPSNGSTHHVINEILHINNFELNLSDSMISPNRCLETGTMDLDFLHVRYSGNHEFSLL
jgi:hypothetical protein